MDMNNVKERLLEENVILKHELTVMKKQIQDVKGAMASALQSADAMKIKATKDLNDKICLLMNQKEQLVAEARYEDNR